MWVVKEIIFWRGKASYLYSTVITIWGLQRKLREGSDHLKDDSEAFRKFPVPEGTSGKSFWRLVKLQQSHRVGPSRSESRGLELVLRTWEGWLWGLRGNSQCPKEPLGRISEGYRSFNEATELSWVELSKSWTLYSGYGNRVQTQRSHFGQGFGGFALNLEVSVSLCDIPK